MPKMKENCFNLSILSSLPHVALFNLNLLSPLYLFNLKTKKKQTKCIKWAHKCSTCMYGSHIVNLLDNTSFCGLPCCKIYLHS
ncbi:hypothetical protein PRUPE_4G000600 [Prunus persica]|uniref:Uncharacterized protein n=1 Tax=Prunus persica TaxID=3760 RepID=A0A251PDH5_PRUPE|nr:hypothetical protein PRUPE_4G000600 [Prunus persica]